MSVPHGFAMGVDLGTSNTVAVIRWPEGRTRPLLVDGVPVLPSGVCLGEDGRLLVGPDAQRLAMVEPARYEPHPKRRIDDGLVLLGDDEVETVRLLAAVLGAVSRAAVEAVGHLPPAVLTFPAAWGTARRNVLSAAAVRAGWPAPRLLPEPIAAAHYFTGILRRPVPVGSCLAVFDFGGGTLDIAVVRNDGSGYTVVGAGGVDDLGGLDVDAALVNHLGGTIAATRPELWHALTNPATTEQRRNNRLFWDDVRGAKEMLSRVTVAPVTVPGLAAAVHLTRDELESVAAPLLRRAVRETDEIVRRCGLRPDELAGLFLVGGSSRLPLVARLLHHELGVAPTVLEQPELPVAEGALAELTPAPGPPPTAGPPFPAQHAGPVPVGSGSRHPGAPGAGKPVLRRPGLIVAAVAVAVVLALAVTVGGWWFLLRDPHSTFAFTELQPTGLTVAYGADSVPSKAASYPDGDVTYLAWTTGDAVNVAAIDTAENRTLWQRPAPAEAKDWRALYAGPDGVILYPGDITATDPKPMVVLDPKDGALKWYRDIGYHDAVVFYQAAVVFSSGDDNAVYGLDWGAGTEKWRLGNRPGTNGVPLATRNFPVEQSGEIDRPGLLGSRTRIIRGDRPVLLQFDVEQGMRVVDVTTGSQRTFTGVPAGQNPIAYAAGDRAHLISTDGNGYQVREYDLTDPGGERVVHTEAAPGRAVRTTPVPCGPERLCYIDQNGDDSDSTHVVALDTARAKVLWREPAPGVTALVGMGDGVLATGDFFPASGLFDGDGNQLLGNDDRRTLGVRLDPANVLLYSREPPGSSRSLRFTGLNLDGARAPLGPVDEIIPSSCSTSRTTLVCGSTNGFQVWRFADA
ncbi:Hsp70 family protein [Polymorphospora rubra]|uniref:Pyrrolo-quinoline quinone repeat domain-containing protein n=1 Tax=Polymorphospora rubra TaxID=338584 RepID=A0A810NDR1_9ACTN|nr:Hsp70 family protein [Polymorphospora rubra]BCJ69633.1 hypothetical protein Prubr_66540 [Polymorphospora rubra]